jgi:hypothetical protein
MAHNPFHQSQPDDDLEEQRRRFRPAAQPFQAKQARGPQGPSPLAQAPQGLGPSPLTQAGQGAQRALAPLPQNAQQFGPGGPVQGPPLGIPGADPGPSAVPGASIRAGAWEDRRAGSTRPVRPAGPDLSSMNPDIWAPYSDPNRIGVGQGPFFQDPYSPQSGLGPPEQAPPSPETTPPPELSREAYRDALMGSGITDIEGLKGFLAQQGGTLVSPTSGTIRTPQGELIDALINASGVGPSRPAWTRVHDPEAAQFGVTSFDAAGGATPSTPSTPSAASSVGGGAGGAQDFQGQVRNRLLQQIEGAGQPVGADDPFIGGVLRSEERGLEKGRRQRRAAMAERFAATGLNPGGAGSGAFNQELTSGFEDKAAAMSGMRAQLFSREMNNRRTQMAGLLNMALQTGDAEKVRSLQLQLAQMDEALRRQGLSQQAAQWGDQYGLQRQELERGLSRDAVLAGLGR